MRDHLTLDRVRLIRLTGSLPGLTTKNSPTSRQDPSKYAVSRRITASIVGKEGRGAINQWVALASREKASIGLAARTRGLGEPPTNTPLAQADLPKPGAFDTWSKLLIMIAWAVLILTLPVLGGFCCYKWF